MVLLDLDRESEYFEVVGPHGNPVISEGVQILQQHSEVIGSGELFQGDPFFFRNSAITCTAASRVWHFIAFHYESRSGLLEGNA